MVLTMHDRAHLALARGRRATCAPSSAPKVYETMIPRNMRVAEAPSHGKPILLYDFDCAGSQAYIKLATEIIERERRNQPRKSTPRGSRGPMNAPTAQKPSRPRARLPDRRAGAGASAAAAGGRAAPGADRRAASRAGSIRARTSATTSWPSSPTSIRSKGLVQPIIVRPRARAATRSSPASAAGARRRRPACTPCR